MKRRHLVCVLWLLCVGTLCLADFSSSEKAFNAVDSDILVSVKNDGVTSQELKMVAEDNDPIWKEESYEPYSDELDSYVTFSGMPDPLDDDSVRGQRYENWLQNYHRVPNVPKLLWSYDDADTAPDVWSSLEKDYLFCDPDLAKTTSSPIDIQTIAAQNECYGPSFNVKSAPTWDSTSSSSTLTELFDRSFIVDVANCRLGQGCQAAPYMPQSFDHDKMILERILFHTPSEHKIDGQQFDMELQFMHCKGSGGALTPGCRPELAVAVLLKDGGASQKDPQFLADLAKTTKEVGPDPKELVKGLQFQAFASEIGPLFNKFYMYWGSTTYPPCYQRVQWYIPSQVVQVSTGLIAAFKARQGENVRPTFALGTRPLKFLSAEAVDHWTYRGPRGVENWGSPRFPWLAYASCGTSPDCEQLPNQAARDVCLAEQKMQSPINIYTNECRPNVDYGGLPCVQQIGLRPVFWNLGRSSDEPLKVYLKDCSNCKPCNNPNNAYTLTLVAPGKALPVSLTPESGGCNSWDSCKIAKGYAAATLTYQNSIYGLREIVVRTPSEHTIDGVSAAAEVQLVADLIDCVKCVCAGWGTAGYGGPRWCCCTPNNNDKPVLIQSLLLVRGKGPGPAWVSGLASVAAQADGMPAALLPDLLFRDIVASMHPAMNKYFLYEGSLTTPPCTARVQWLVVKPMLEVDDKALAALAAVTVGGNSRPVQALNGRTLAVAGTVQL